MAKPEATFWINAKDGTKAAFKTVNRSMEKLRRFTISTQSAILGLVGVGGMGALVKTSLNAADQIGKLHQRLGASTEALSQYRHVADLSNVTFESLTLGWQRMTRRIAEASQGTGEAVGALREMHLSASALNKLKPEQQFEILADALHKVDNQADRVRLAMKLFDTDGVALLQTMENGSAGIREMRNEADKLGKTLSIDQVNKAAAANDAMTRLKSSVTGLGESFAIRLVPALTNTIDFIRNQAIPAFTFLFERIGLIKSSINSLTEDEIFARMSLLREKMKDLSDEVRASAPLSPFPEHELDKLKSMSAEYAKLQERLDGLHQKQTEILTGNTGVQDVGNVASTEEDPQVTKTRNMLAQKLAVLEEGWATESEREKAAYEARQFMIETAYQDEAVNYEKRTQLLQELELRHQAAMGNIEAKGLIARRKFHQMTAKQQVMTQLDMGIQMTQGLATTSKTMFEINKAYSLAKAAAALPSAVIDSFNNGGGYPWGLIPAGLMLATGLAQINAIKNSSFESASVAPSLTGSGGGSTTVGNVPVGTSNTPTLPDNGLSTQQTQPTKQINISISGNPTAEQTRDLINAINEEVGNGAELKATIAA